MPSRHRRLNSIAALGFAVLSCAGPKNSVDEIRESERRREQAVRDAASDATRSLNAVSDWTTIKEKFTANVRSALVRPDGRPVFFSGRIRDIDAEKESYSLTLDVDSWMVGAIRFRLGCDSETVRSLLHERPGRRLVGVATLTDVRMTRDASDLILNDLQRQFLATGHCLYIKILD